MIKSFLNGVIGGFSRTLGRILFYIFIALIFYFIFGLKNVDAAELNINANVYSTSGNTFYQRMYTGTNYYAGSQSESNFSLGTTYSGRLRQISFRVDRTFNYTNSYKLTLQANSTDFRNNIDSIYVSDMQNEYVCNTISTQFISKSKISVTFVCPYQTNSVLFNVYAKEGYFLTGDSNFNIKNVLLEEITNDGNNDDIINNNNENTQDIINNNNSNTQDIINNQNQNQEQTNELLGFCYKNLFNYNVYNNSIPQLQKNNSYGFTITGDYYAVDSGVTLSDFCPSCQVGKTYYLNADSSSPDSKFSYLSLSGYTWQFGTLRTLTSTDLTSTLYFYNRWEHSSSDVTTINGIMITEKNVSTFGEYNKQICTSKIDNVNDTLTSQSPMDSSIFSTWWTNFTQNQFSNPLGNLITLPINLVQKLINYSSTACSPVQLGSLLGTNLTLTCFTLGDIITNSTVLNVIDLIMSLSLVVFTLKKAYETVSNLISLGGENEVKQHFKFPTPMEFIASLFGGGR